MSSISPMYLPATSMTPEVDFRPADGYLHIGGESYPENVVAFYGPILEALRAHLQGRKAAELHVVIAITYYNSASAKAFHRLMSLFSDAAQAGCHVRVDWRHDEEDEMMIELGNDLREEYEAIDFLVTAIGTT